MQQLHRPLLFILLLTLHASGQAQAEEKFLLPVSPSGEEIKDIRLLTVSDTVSDKDLPTESGADASSKKEEPTAVNESQKIIELKHLKFNKMRHQLQELSVLWGQLQNRQSQSSAHQSPPYPAPVPPPSVEGSDSSRNQVSPGTENAEIRTDTNLSQPPEVTQREPHSEDSVPPATTDPVSVDVPASEVLTGSDSISTPEETGSIDRFALATSLFATGYYNECLHALDSITLAELETHETIWLSYLRAGCHRKLGATDEANRVYRRIVANPDAEWVGTVSRWWLDHMQDRQKLKFDLLTLTTSVKQWEAAVHDLAQ